MKNLMFDKEDIKFLNKELIMTKRDYAIVRLREMQPNKNTLRIIREDKLKVV